MTDQPDTPKTPVERRKKRISRYQRAQERRDAQRRSDQRFYNLIFSVIGVCVLVVLGLAMLASGGQAPTVPSEAADAVQRTGFGLTWLEVGGLVLVAIIGIFMWRRINKR